MKANLALLAVLALVGQAAAQTCPLALTRWVVRRNESRQLVEAALSADGSFNATNAAPNGPSLNVYPQLSLARVTLQPCGVRTMHIHSNVDELLYVLSGTVGASTVYANGTICEQATLNSGDSYAYPRNLVHSARNPSCNTTAVVLGFFSAIDSATINIASSAYNIPGSPFKSYADREYNASLLAAISPSTLAFDADCLARCRLGAQGGQQPADRS